MVADVVSRVTKAGALPTELEGLGTGVKSKALITDLITDFKKQTDASFNVKTDATLTEAEKPKHQTYVDTQRTFLENTLNKLPEILTARSKDLTLSASAKFEQTRHQDLLDKFVQTQADQAKAHQATITNPKASDVDKATAQGALDAYNGVIQPAIQKIKDVFKQEWEGKQSPVGTKIPADTLAKPDNWNGSEYACAG